MRRLSYLPLLAFLLAFAPIVQAQATDGRIHGIVHTVDGERFEGFIRWDKNEVAWLDLLNGSKEIDRRYRERADGNRRNAWLNIRWTRNEGSRTRESGVRFGDLARLDVTGRDEARLTLRSGEQVTFEGGSTDIGTDTREILVDDVRAGRVELDWRDIDYIEFGQGDVPTRPHGGEQLYGQLTTRHGDTFTGWVRWDVDEALTDDELDGDDERGRDRSIPFGRIAAIERDGRGATITLLDGDSIYLDDSNDVNDGNRGILVLDPAVGQVQVSWRDFDRIDFRPAPPSPAYDRFAAPRRLSGTVETRDGELYKGEIRWDGDEAYTWELLDGQLDDLQFDIPFALIREITRTSSRSATIVLLDGRDLELSDSNDVNEENNGIFVTLADGEDIRISWRDFARVTFDA